MGILTSQKKYSFLNAQRKTAQDAPQKEREIDMLNLNLKEGEYLTIGDNIVVQTFPFGSQTQVLIDAPRELTVLRGKLRERSGDQKPDAVIEGCRKQTPSARRHAEERRAKQKMRESNRESAQTALIEINAMLDAVGATPEAVWLRERMKRIAPVVE